MSTTIARPFVGDVGIALQMQLVDNLDQPIDLSAATLKQMIFRKPDGTIVTKPAQFATDGTDGKVDYLTETGFLDQAGQWQRQTYIETASEKFHSAILDFPVLAPLG